MILAKCSRMLDDPDEAHDVAQETFTRLWARRRTVRDAKAVTAWLYRTSTRLAIDRLRLRARLEPDNGAEPAGPVDLEDQAAARMAIQTLCRRAPAKEMEVVLLSAVDGLTHVEISAVTGRSERTVRRLLASFQKRRPSRANGRQV